MANGQRCALTVTKLRAFSRLLVLPGNAVDLLHKVCFSLCRSHKDAAPGGGHQV